MVIMVHMNNKIQIVDIIERSTRFLIHNIIKRVAGKKLKFKRKQIN